jgi:hypothetical protein
VITSHLSLTIPPASANFFQCMPRAVTILDIVHVPEESINHFFVFLQKLCREPGSKGIRQIRINNGPGGKRFSWKDKKTDSSLFVSFFGRVVISSNRLAEQGIMLLDADTCSLSVVQQQRLGKCASVCTGCALTPTNTVR